MGNKFGAENKHAIKADSLDLPSDQTWPCLGVVECSPSSLPF